MLYSEHIVTVYAVRPIIWDDMLRDVFKADIQNYKLGNMFFFILTSFTLYNLQFTIHNLFHIFLGFSDYMVK